MCNPPNQWAQDLDHDFPQNATDILSRNPIISTAFPRNKLKTKKKETRNANGKEQAQKLE